MSSKQRNQISTTSASAISLSPTLPPSNKRTRAQGAVPPPGSSNNDLKEMISQCLHEVLQSPDSIAQIVSAVTETVLARLEMSIGLNMAAIEDLKEEISVRDKKIDMLQSMLENRTDDLELYTRRNSVRIYGIEEKQHENTDELTVILSKEKLGVALTPSDIDRSHRVGKPIPGKNRPILVKFISYRKRSEVFKRKSQLKGTSVTIREDLTKGRMQVLKEAVSAFGLRNVWTEDGRIIAKDASGRKHSFRSCEEIRTLLQTNS